MVASNSGGAGVGGAFHQPSPTSTGLHSIQGMLLQPSKSKENRRNIMRQMLGITERAMESGIPWVDDVCNVLLKKVSCDRVCKSYSVAELSSGRLCKPTFFMNDHQADQAGHLFFRLVIWSIMQVKCFFLESPSGPSSGYFFLVGRELPQPRSPVPL